MFKKIMLVGALAAFCCFGCIVETDAYEARIQYFFQGLDIDTGQMYIDPTVFFILPEDEFEKVLVPPNHFEPNFDPAVDVFVENITAQRATLKFLPSSVDGASRITEVLVGEESFKIAESFGVPVTIEIPVNGPISFLTADRQRYGNLWLDEWAALLDTPPSPAAVPEPTTALLLGTSLLGLFMWKRCKKRLMTLLIGLPLLAGLSVLTPQSAAAAFCDNVTEIPRLECEALETLYINTDGANWSYYSGGGAHWMTTNTPCSWQGVSCSAGHVTALMLRNNLNGQLPDEIGNLTALESLDLAANVQIGRIPATIGNLTQLKTLNLFNAGAIGPIPPEIGNLAQLRELELTANFLTGSIPPELGNLQNLQFLKLYGNRLHGQLPAALGNLTQLRLLGVWGNELSGAIPAELGSLSQLETLDLRQNNLSGNLPASLGHLSNLTALLLSENPALAGPLPSTLASLSELTSLSLDGTNMCNPEGVDFQHVEMNLPSCSGINQYTITAAAGNGGEISPGGNVTVLHGNTVQFLLQADSGYIVDRVLVDGIDRTAQLSQPGNSINKAAADVDCDGRITFNDAATIEQHVEGHFSLGQCVTMSPHVIPGDADGNGSVNEDDAKLLRLYGSGGLPPLRDLFYVLENITAPHSIEVSYKEVFDSLMEETHGGQWRDANKIGSVDTQMCWAAASANVLDWSGFDRPPEYENEEQMFERFRQGWENKGSLMRHAWRWWLEGTPPPDMGMGWAGLLSSPASSATEQPGGFFANAYASHWEQEGLDEALKNYLHEGFGVTIALYDKTNTAIAGHVLSVWGYQHDSAGNLLGLWVTDSDDGSRARWLLPVIRQTGEGTQSKWRVGGNMPIPVKAMLYAGWLIEGVEALKPKAATTPAAPGEASPTITTVRKKCVDSQNTEIACPVEGKVAVSINDRVCDEECKRMVVDTAPNQAIVLKVVIDEDGEDLVTFKGWEVNGQMWPADKPPILRTDKPEDIFLRPVIGCNHN